MGKANGWKVLSVVFCLIVAGWSGLVAFGQSGSLTMALTTGGLLFILSMLVVACLMRGAWKRL